MTFDVGTPGGRAPGATRAGTGVSDDDTPPNPWTRVLGILVLGSFAAATKTARGSRRDLRRPSASDAQPEAAT